MNNSIVGCGQCIHCRANRRREWVHRILLEMKSHDLNTFLTLTYDNDHLPDGGTLVPEHVTTFIKRLRYHYDQPIKYYAVGEYGEETERPHYHIALFNHPNCKYGRTRNRPLCCDECTKLKKIWSMGNVYLGELNEHSATYIAGYILKKLTNEKDERLQGRYPEFARMSKKPAIGSAYIDNISEQLIKYKAREVPFYLLQGQKYMPLDNYMRNAISKKTNLPKAKKLQEDVRILYEDEEISNLPREFKTMVVEHQVADRKRFKRDHIEREYNRRRRGKIL